MGARWAFDAFTEDATHLATVPRVAVPGRRGPHVTGASSVLRSTGIRRAHRVTTLMGTGQVLSGTVGVNAAVLRVLTHPRVQAGTPVCVIMPSIATLFPFESGIILQDRIPLLSHFLGRTIPLDHTRRRVVRQSRHARAALVEEYVIGPFEGDPVAGGSGDLLDGLGHRKPADQGEPAPVLRGSIRRYQSRHCNCGARHVLPTPVEPATSRVLVTRHQHPGQGATNLDELGHVGVRRLGGVDARHPA